MFLNFLFRKKIEEFKSNEIKLLQQIGKLNSEKNELENEIKNRDKRFERIKFLLNERVNRKSRCFIEQTKKGRNILTSINEQDYEIEVFDIDDVEINSNRELVLWATSREKEYFIKDIQGGNSLGHGEIAMNHLIDYSKKQNKEYITGQISSTDYDHKDRLISFYKKMGFEVNFLTEDSGILLKKLY